MNTEEAKTILAVCRPGRPDLGDPELAQALEVMRRDPAVAAWFDEEQRMDAVIRRKLGGMTVPEDLVGRILGVRAANGISRISRRRGLLSLAAMVVVLLGLGGLWMWQGSGGAGRGTDFEAFRSDMPEFLSEFPRLDVMTERMEQVREWLGERQPALAAGIPSGLENLPPLGCREVEWRGRQLALVCFIVRGEVVHLFVMRASDWPETDWGTTARYERQGEMTTAAWVEGDSAYLVVSRGGEEFLAGIL